MLHINILDCITKKSTKAPIFVFLIFSKSLNASNIAIFKNFNINPMNIIKTEI